MDARHDVTGGRRRGARLHRQRLCGHPGAGGRHGYADAPIATETQVAGVYADKPDIEHGGIQLHGSVNLPGWTQLDVIVAGRRYQAAAASGYRQALDLRRGVVTTTATWSGAGG